MLYNTFKQFKCFTNRPTYGMTRVTIDPHPPLKSWQTLCCKNVVFWSKVLREWKEKCSDRTKEGERKRELWETTIKKVPGKVNQICGTLKVAWWNFLSRCHDEKWRASYFIFDAMVMKSWNNDVEKREWTNAPIWSPLYCPTADT